MHAGIGMHREITDLKIKGLNQADTWHQDTEKTAQRKEIMFDRTHKKYIKNCSCRKVC